MMRPIDKLGMGPTRSIEKIDKDTSRLTVTPPKWSGFTKGSSVILTADQVGRYVRWMETGSLIQDALPELSAAEREIIVSGIAPQDWDAAFKDDEEED